MLVTVTNMAIAATQVIACGATCAWWQAFRGVVAVVITAWNSAKPKGTDIRVGEYTITLRAGDATIAV